MRAAPELLGRLPPQYFAGVLAAAAKARAEPGPPFLDLGRGNPDLPPPERALAALRSATAETRTPAIHGYPPFRGLPALREAIVRRYALEHGVELDPEREVAVLPGTKTGIMLVAQAAAGPGEGVGVPDPGYPDYRSGVALAGAYEVPVPLDAGGGWQPDLDGLAGEDLALLLLNYPSNPCGAAAAPGTLQAAVDFAHAGGTWLVHDLAYDTLAFDAPGGIAPSVLSLPGAREVGAELWSPSKRYGMAGWRVGFLLGNAELVGRVQALLDHTAVGVFAAVQHGLLAALEGGQADVDERRETYRRRRDRLVAGLRAAGADVATPAGTFYVWWRLPAGLTPERLAREARVGVAPGVGFGARGEGWARLSLAVPDAELEEATRRLAAAVGANEGAV